MTDEQADYYKSGIHLYNPSKRKIEDAKEAAVSKGFEVIYIHENSPALTNADKRFLRELNLFKKVFNCSEPYF